jgi:L-alanine-DL-glutamate epimerase-like enolase superfamily enzyme
LITGIKELRSFTVMNLRKERGESESTDLVWMGSAEFLDEQIRNKLKEGYACIKLKVGAIDFDAELSLIKKIRKEYQAEDVEIRVDANGAFDPAKAMDRLSALAALHVHSIEQPVKAGTA